MTDRSTSTPDTNIDARTRAKLLDLSLTQLVGGSLAAATAAALGSRLGLAGTIAGASVGSVITAVAANVYTNSMSRAREAVVLARATGRVRSSSPRPDRWRMPQAPTVRRTAFTAAVVFALAGAFLTGLQLTTGAPVTGTDLGPRSAAAAVVGAPGQKDVGTAGGDAPGDASTGIPVPPTPGVSASTTIEAPATPGAHTAPPSSDATPSATPSTTTPPIEQTPQDTVTPTP